MMAELIDRKQRKYQASDLLETAQVSPKAMTALYLGINLLLNMATLLAGDTGFLSTFVYILVSFLSLVLTSGFVLYCMAIRRGERAEFLTLFDGFSFAGKIIGLNLVMYIFISLWSMLFIFPGIVASYRYRFALYNLYENPELSILQALEMSKRQTMGYKAQLFFLDVSYFGWNLLATLPLLAQTSILYTELLAPASTMGLSIMAKGAMLPDWGWALLIGVWSLVVSLFYLCHFYCVELGYFETAKSTSGVGEGCPSHQDA